MRVQIDAGIEQRLGQAIYTIGIGCVSPCQLVSVILGVVGGDQSVPPTFFDWPAIRPPMSVARKRHVSPTWKADTFLAATSRQIVHSVAFRYPATSLIVKLPLSLVFWGMEWGQSDDW